MDHSNLFLIKKCCEEGDSYQLKEILSLLDLTEVDKFFKNIGSPYPIHLASTHNHLNIVQVLLNKGDNVNKKTSCGDTPLHIACENGFTELVELLINNGADFHSRNILNKAPLAGALKNHHTDIVIMFLRKKLCLRGKSVMSLYSNFTVFDDICNFADAKVIRCLLSERKIRVNNFLLAEFVLKNQKEIVQLLIEHGADFKERSVPTRNSMLHIASSEGLNEMVNFFLQKGFNVNIRNIYKHAPIHLAAVTGNVDTIELLQKHGAAMEVKDIKGCTPLQLAAYFNKIDSIDVLYKLGADINAQDSDQDTALHNCQYPQVAKILLLRGISTEIKNKAQLTAYDTLDNMMKKLYTELLEEISKMKNIRLNNFSSLYDVLSMNSNDLSRYVNNVVFSKMFSKAVGFSSEFPHYGYDLSRQYTKGWTRKRLIDAAVEFFNKLINMKLPDLCYLTIFRFCSNLDLKNFLKESNCYDVLDLFRFM